MGTCSAIRKVVDEIAGVSDGLQGGVFDTGSIGMSYRQDFGYAGDELSLIC